MNLQPGDYVSNEGMTEEQYHAVCKAFIDAGAEKGEYGRYTKDIGSHVGWSYHGLFHGYALGHTCWNGAFTRELTIQQILGGPEQMNMSVQGAEGSMSLAEAYKVMQANCGIEVGDTVKVLRKAKDKENGWGINWHTGMTSFIGDEHVVRSINDLGIVMKDSSYAFPFFVLERIKKGKKLPYPVRISSEYKAMFREDGGIDVGCQRLSFDKLEEIYLTAKGVKDGNL